MENLPAYLKKEELRIVPGLLARANLFNNDPNFGLKLKKESITDVRSLMPEFESLLKLLVEDLFNPAVPFDQTTNEETCTYCPYKEICGR